MNACSRCGAEVPAGSDRCAACAAVGSSLPTAREVALARAAQLTANLSPAPEAERQRLARRQGLAAAGGGCLTFLGVCVLLIFTASYLDAGKNLFGFIAACMIFAGPPLVLGGLALAHAKALGRRLKSAVLPAAVFDPDAQFRLLETEVRRMLGRLRGPYRAQAGELAAEVSQIHARWEEASRRLAALSRDLPASDEERLQTRHVELVAEIAAEDDEVTRGALRQQLAAVEGQLAAGQCLATAKERLTAAREASMETLLHLRTELAVHLANAGGQPAETLREATHQLQSLNTTLSAAREATEEVLRLGA